MSLRPRILPFILTNAYLPWTLSAAFFTYSLYTNQSLILKYISKPSQRRMRLSREM
jgi:hypothetical protein